jgi:hypothetical protein
VVVSCLLAAGCGGSGNSKPKPISGPAKQVADVVERFQKATASGDFVTICDDLFATSTRKQAGGDQCAALLAQRAQGVRRPRIRIKSIEVQGDSAAVQVTTTAAGQAAASDVIRLVREGGRFRVDSLGR